MMSSNLHKSVGVKMNINQFCSGVMQCESQCLRILISKETKLMLIMGSNFNLTRKTSFLSLTEESKDEISCCWKGQLLG